MGIRAFSAKVTSLRQVDWEACITFLHFPSGAGRATAKALDLTSFRWENGSGMLTQLNREFPTVSLLDIRGDHQSRWDGCLLEQMESGWRVMVVLVTLCGMLYYWRSTGRYASAPSGAGGVAHVRSRKKLLRTTLWCEFAMRG